MSTASRSAFTDPPRLRRAPGDAPVHKTERKKGRVSAGVAAERGQGIEGEKRESGDAAMVILNLGPIRAWPRSAYGS